MIVHPDIEAYLDAQAPRPHPVLAEMEALAAQRDFPIIGPVVGRLLAALIKFGHVHTVLECGSGYGYSAFWIALALPANGRIICTEYDPENIALARDFLGRANLLRKVTFLEGDARETVPPLKQTFDMILNDVDKEHYLELLPILHEKLRVGGVLVTDNVLWKGKVAGDGDDATTRAIRAYNKALLDMPSLWNTILPMRDGVAVSVKLQLSD